MAYVATLMLIWLLAAPLSNALADDVPPEANGAPNELPQGERPEIGWSLQNLDPEQRQRMLRFSTFVNGDIPEAYQAAENTVGYTVSAIAEGGPLYKNYCLSCHGETGLGNGNLAYALTPSPALLAYMVQQPIAVDHYLLWSIAEGGEQFGSSMPAFKDRLSDEQIFQIIAYLRAGFPGLDDGDKPAGAQSPGAVTIDEPNANGQPAE